MRYTQSPDTVTHGGTGHQMHSDTNPITSVVSAEDMNMLIWEAMAILEAAGIAGVAFNPNSAATYTQVLQALNQLFITPAELAAYAPSATQTLQGLVELATSAEGIAGTDFVRAVSPGVLAAVLAAKVATTAVAGLVELADAAESTALTVTDRAMTPYGLGLVASSRPGHVYTDDDWIWLDKPQGLILQWMTASFTNTGSVGASVNTVVPYLAALSAVHKVFAVPGVLASGGDGAEQTYSVSSRSLSSATIQALRVYGSYTTGEIGYFTTFVIGRV